MSRRSPATRRPQRTLYDAALTGRTINVTASATDPSGTHFGARLYVLSWSGTDLLIAHAGADGAFVGTMAPITDGLDDHIEVAQGPNGNLFISSEQSSSVLEYQLDGTLVGTFVTAGSGGLSAHRRAWYLAPTAICMWPPTAPATSFGLRWA
ncbi:MAG: hypothetical protein R3E48_16770 [Burkholderiaceae bacterium]